MMWKKRKKKQDQFNFENFDDFIFDEIYNFLDKVQPLINVSNSTAETLACVDSMIIGVRHAIYGEEMGEYCYCCKHWCLGAECPVVKEAWSLFLQTLPDLKSVIRHEKSTKSII